MLFSILYANTYERDNSYNMISQNTALVNLSSNEILIDRLLSSVLVANGMQILLKEGLSACDWITLMGPILPPL